MKKEDIFVSSGNIFAKFLFAAASKADKFPY
jgi:hypothetical protein